MRSSYARLAALAVALTASSCAWLRPKADPTEFFVLEPRPAAGTARKDRPRVELAEVEVPAYLKNPRMAARLGDNEIDYAEYKRWGEPLPQGIARAVREDLREAAELPAAPSPDGPAQYSLTLRVLAFEGLRPPSGAAGIRVSAAWELRPLARPGPALSGRFEAAPAAWDGKDYAGLARLLSGAVAELCAELKKAIP